MDRMEKYALDAAREITIARVSNTTLTISGQTGEQVGDFLEAIYKKILKIQKAAENDTTETE